MGLSSDSFACLNPIAAENIPVCGKEIACHISWKIGVLSAKFATFAQIIVGLRIRIPNIQMKTNWWLMGEMDTHRYMSIGKTRSHKAIIENVNVSCFWKHIQKQLACGMLRRANFIAFDQPWTCLGKYCYLTYEKIEVEKEMWAELVNLKSESNEGLRYNFGLISPNF